MIFFNIGSSGNDHHNHNHKHHLPPPPATTTDNKTIIITTKNNQNATTQPLNNTKLRRSKLLDWLSMADRRMHEVRLTWSLSGKLNPFRRHHAEVLGVVEHEVQDLIGCPADSSRVDIAVEQAPEWPLNPARMP